MLALSNETLKSRLGESFTAAEALVRDGACPALPSTVESNLDSIFDSATQAYREVLIGCALMSIEAPTIDIRKPYSNQGPDAFNGRSLDEAVVNPFLQEKRVPSSRGPYLSTFRRSVDFTPSTRQGVRDKAGFDALLELIEYLRSTTLDRRISFLTGLLCRFVRLREASNIPLSRLNRVSVVQYSKLLTGLLSVPSGGRIPVIVVVATLYAIKAHFSLSWSIDFQGINEADAPGGAGGDVTVRDGGAVIFAAEVTEREVDKSRVVAIFNRKISPAGIRDYIFFARGTGDAVTQASQYFAQGSEVNFVDINTWTCMSLVTMGQAGRDAFNSQLTSMLNGDDIPRTVKVAWNELVAGITSV